VRLSLVATFDQIELHFMEVRGFFLNDLDRIVAQPVGGNYAATVLIFSAYEALGNLRDSKGHVPFREQLPPRWRPVSESLYGALRNGLVHGYEPKVIDLGAQRVKLALSWRERPHLSFSDEWLCLNVQEMARELRQAFVDYELRLREDSALRDGFRQRRARHRVHKVLGGDELAAWRALLGGSHAVDDGSQGHGALGPAELPPPRGVGSAQQ